MDAFRRHAFLIVSLWIVLGTTAKADPYYQLTDLNSVYQFNGSSSGDSASGPQGFAGNPQTGTTYPFPTTPIDTLNSNGGGQPGLPGITGQDGLSGDNPVFFPMVPFAENSLGTIIGGVPSGASLANPYSDLSLGYTQKLPDGQYTPFTQLTGSQHGADANIYLTATNLIAVTQQSSPYMFGDWTGAKIFNLNNHTSFLLSQVIPPNSLAPPSDFQFLQIADNGSILAYVLSPSTTARESSCS